MKFHNIAKIMDNVGVHNKYLLTFVVAQRARQISEIKGENDVAARHPGEKPISLALADMEDGNVCVEQKNETIVDAIESEGKEQEAANESEASQPAETGESLS